MPTNLFKQYNVKPAIAEDHKNLYYRDWVYSVARKIDITNPEDAALVRDLGIVMEQALRKYRWCAASSNNLHWNGTGNPIRVVMVPHPEDGTNIILVNPQNPEYGSREFINIEGCGSFPGHLYFVKRRSSARVCAYMLDETGFSLVCLEYGIMDFEDDGRKLPSNLERKLRDVSYVQHEIDHLDGIVIAKKIFFI